MRAHAIYGPPGTGKTTEMLRRVEQLRTVYKPHEIAFLSFTKAAASEALSRLGLERSDYVSTIHSLCFRLCEQSPQSVVNRARLREFSELISVPMGFGDLETGEGEIEEGDEYMSVINRARARMVDPMQEYEASERPGTQARFEMFGESYHRYKVERGYIDFDDMLAEFIDNHDVTHRARVLMVDESQDLSQMQWTVVRQLIERGLVEEVHVAGDDDQCQPPGTLVMTPNGQVPIQLLRNGDKVVSYNRTGGQFEARTVRVASRPFAGQLIQIITGDACSRYTPGHKCMVTFVDDPELRVVYLMRKGNRFRIGQAKAFKYTKHGTRTMYLTYRAQQERADAAWILYATRDAADAYSQEQLLSAKWGIPQTMFDAESIGLRAKYLTQVWAALDTLDLEERADRLLHSLGMSLDLPLIKHNGGTKHFMCYACNLIPQLHLLARSDGKSLHWVPFTKSQDFYEGMVHSLDVDKTATYIADGIYTHNSIFEWSGADPHGMAQFEGDYDAKREVLSQSHRVPGAVWALAQRVIKRVQNRVDKSYLPRAEEGTVGTINHISAVHGQDTLVLARNHSVIKEVEQELLDSCIPYSKVGGMPGPFEHRAGQALLALRRLKDGVPITAAMLEAMVAGADVKWRDVIKRREFDKLKGVNPLSVISAPWKFRYYYERVDISVKPTVKLMTIHSAKGKEANRVILIDAMGGRTAVQAASNPDAEARVWYVAVTRAKDRLDVLEGDNPYGLC